MRAAFIFPGQGSQSIGMGKEIYENFRPAVELLQNASDSLKIDFSNLLFNENDLINRSEFTQPAIVLNSLMCYLALKQSVNLKPKFALGHSLGEFSALAVSGAFDFTGALRIVNLRGKFMQEDCAGKDVTMSVILGLSDETVEQICKNAQPGRCHQELRLLEEHQVFGHIRHRQSGEIPSRLSSYARMGLDERPQWDVL